MCADFLKRPGKPDLAYLHSHPGKKDAGGPAVIFLGGYRSDMQGTKATYFEQQCQARGQAYTRFDYSGHGQSGGRFEDGTIGAWTEDTLDIFDHFIREPAVLVGSSMGGWIALLVALKRSALIRGVVGLAAAPDFTEQMYEERLSAQERQELEKKGYFSIPNDYSDEPYVFTKKLHDEAKNHLLLKKGRPVNFSLRLIQGMKDKEVPWQTAAKIQNAFQAEDSDIILIEDGDHRLSRPQDLELIDKEIKNVSGIA